MEAQDNTAATTEADPAPVCVFKKPTRKNTRKRTGDESAITDETPTVIAQPKTKATKEADSITHHATSKSQAIEAVRYQSSGTASSLGSGDQFATATLETETEFDRDGVAILKRVKNAATKEDTNSNDGLYHGMNQYRSFIQKRDDSGVAKGAGIRAGPVRASAHIRVTARFDYQPDLCKDFKETGYCGYGDACKFMHDRGDYKTGWQLEREWDEQQKIKAIERASGKREEPEAPAEEEDDTPFACFICRRPFTHPVVTKCKHFFCERCALDHHAKNKKCFVCEEPTGGIFNVPSKQLLAKIAKKQQQMEQNQQGQEGEGGEGGEQPNEEAPAVEGSES